MCEVIQKHLNLDALIVLPEGLHGDHTDGHIDNVARFIAEDVVVMAEPKTGDENEKILQKAYRQLKEWRHPIHKTPLKIKFLPSLRPICKQNDIFPLSFLNFIFLNSALLYPSYGESSENKVKDALHTWFPEREILGIDCRLLIEEGGALHCMTRQQPSLERF
jgi:agmatine deiminase